MPILGTGFGIEKFGDINTNPSGNNTPLYFSNCATPSALPSCTYSNGTGGVGATLTATSNGALTTTYTDGVAVSVGLIILVWKQSSALQNGLYEITQIGTGSTPWILTRLGVYDATAEIYPSQVNVIGGSTYANLYFLEQTASPTIGSSSIVYQTATAPTGTTINQNLRLVDTYTTSALPTCTYTSGSSATIPGLNAYLNATSNGAFPTLNGVAPFQYMKVLVSGQADQKQNGDYMLMNIGSASSTWRLTRISYTSSALYPAWWGIYSGTGKGLIFEQTTSTLTTATIGVSGNIVFVQVSSSGLTYFTEAQSTASPNATVNVDSLTAVAGSTNADFSIVPKGSGAFLLAIPDGTTTGGDKRGLGAIDLQISRTNANQVASGNYSFIAGRTNRVVLDDGYAIGRENTVTSYYGGALGYQNSTSGSYAICLGYGNIASGQSATSIGYANNSSAIASTSIGWGNVTSGQYAVCLGNGNTGSGNYSSSIGRSNTVNGVYGVGIGYSNTASQEGAICIGYTSTSTAICSVSIGQSSNATANDSVSLGRACNSSGVSAVSIGKSNTSGGKGSIVLGSFGNAYGISGKFSFGSFSTSNIVIGDSQSGLITLTALTTDATTTTMVTDWATSTTPSTINQLILQDAQLISFQGKIQGKQTSSTNIGVWQIDGTIVRGSGVGTTTLVISNVTLVTNASGWGTPTLTADTTNGGLKVQVAGLVATNIKWSCRIDTVETLY